ncbi:hypothetical protein L226DRAFT_567717 [Lentinus tigrinus ALCF2SS1-7]|uniref:uncharacterized protein n=1 Tax=Lentinus tigrinus ALCF2SS1-7 TaxID=1328758 RepID=UPI001165DB8C|nr:hypothetical protein L226DRAFT_567717 [Lentinus tigrinus ALCF2SS1-7]
MSTSGIYPKGDGKAVAAFWTTPHGKSYHIGSEYAAYGNKPSSVWTPYELAPVQVLEPELFSALAFSDRSVGAHFATRWGGLEA